MFIFKVNGYCVQLPVCLFKAQGLLNACLSLMLLVLHMSSFTIQCRAEITMLNLTVCSYYLTMLLIAHHVLKLFSLQLICCMLGRVPFPTDERFPALCLTMPYNPELLQYVHYIKYVLVDLFISLLCSVGLCNCSTHTE